MVRLRMTAMFLLFGCTAQPQSDLARRVDSLSAIVDSLHHRVGRLEIDSWLATLDGVAVLKPADQGYSTLKSDYGTITVALEDVNGFANGSRVMLRFGNTTSATLNDVTATVEWGRVDSSGVVINDPSNTKEVSLQRPLRAGSWTVMPVVLDRIPPQELGFIRITNFANRGISLSR